MSLVEHWSARLRQRMTAELRQDLERLARAVEGQGAAWRDPEALRPLVDDALAAQAARQPERLAEALRPIVTGLVRAEERRRALRRRRVIAAVLAVSGGAGLLLWRHEVPRSVAAPHLPSLAMTAPAATAGEGPTAAGEALAAVVLAEDEGGFGLGHAARSDAELAGEVRQRLARCAPLRGAEVSFAVREGWVWLRGRASEAGREAAAAALGDLGEGVVVVNQITGSGPDAVAEGERERDG